MKIIIKDEELPFRLKYRIMAQRHEGDTDGTVLATNVSPEFAQWIARAAVLANVEFTGDPLATRELVVEIREGA